MLSDLSKCSAELLGFKYSMSGSQSRKIFTHFSFLSEMTSVFLLGSIKIPEILQSITFPKHCAVLNHSVVSDTCNPMDCSMPCFSVHGDSPGKNTEVGCRVLLQGIFRTQELNPGLLHCRQILYCLSHQGS